MGPSSVDTSLVKIDFPEMFNKEYILNIIKVEVNFFVPYYNIVRFYFFKNLLFKITQELHFCLVFDHLY